MILHLPHASTSIAPEDRQQFLLSDECLAEEIRIMTDLFTDELFRLPTGAGATVRFPTSRIVTDPERFECDADEMMSGRGMGVLYTHTSDGRALRPALVGHERERLLQRWYRPHHAALTSAVGDELDNRGSCLIVDAHSFPSAPLPHEHDQGMNRPDICIGTDAFHTPGAVVSLLVALCRDLGWTVEIDRPFAGALVPMAYYRTDTRVRSVMIEVNRGLYLDESTGQKGAGFLQCQAAVDRLIEGLVRSSCEGVASGGKAEFGT